MVRRKSGEKIRFTWMERGHVPTLVCPIFYDIVGHMISNVTVGKSWVGCPDDIVLAAAHLSIA